MAQQELQRLSGMVLLQTIIEPPTLTTKEPDISRIKDDAAAAAMVRIPLAEVQEIHTKPLNEELRYLTERAGAADRLLVAVMMETESKLVKIKLDLETDEGKYRQNLAALPSLEQRERETEGEARKLRRVVKAKELEFTIKQQALVDDGRRCRQNSELTHRQDFARKEAALELEARTANEVYLETIASEAKRDLEELEAPLQAAKAETAKLHDQGLSPFLGYILLWISAASLGATAILLTWLFASRHRPSAGPSEAFRGFQAWLHIGGASPDFLGGFGRYIGLVLLGGFVVLATCLLMYTILSWLEGQSHPKHQPTKEDNEWLGGLLSFFHMASPELTKGLASLTRSSIPHILTLLPVFVAVSVGYFGWMILAAPASTSSTSQATTQEIYLGLVFLLLFLSSATVFWTFVGRPSSRGQEVSFGLKTGYALLCSLPIFAILCYATLPPDMNNLANAILAISAMVPLYGGAIGMQYRGAMQREVSLQLQKDRLRSSLIEKERIPTSQDYLNARVEAEERQLRSAMNHQPERTLWQRIVVFFQPDQMESDPARIEENHVDKLLDESYVPPEEIEKINEAMRIHERALAELSVCKNEIRRLETEIAKANGEMNSEGDFKNQIGVARIQLAERNGKRLMEITIRIHAVIEAVRLGHAWGQTNAGRLAASH